MPETDDPKIVDIQAYLLKGGRNRRQTADQPPITLTELLAKFSKRLGLFKPAATIEELVSLIQPPLRDVKEGELTAEDVARIVRKDAIRCRIPRRRPATILRFPQSPKDPSAS